MDDPGVQAWHVPVQEKFCHPPCKLLDATCPLQIPARVPHNSQSAQESGEDALAFLEVCPSLPDVVLLDVTLPGMSGFKVGGAICCSWVEDSTLPGEQRHGGKGGGLGCRRSQRWGFNM